MAFSYAIIATGRRGRRHASHCPGHRLRQAKTTRRQRASPECELPTRTLPLGEGCRFAERSLWGHRRQSLMSPAQNRCVMRLLLATRNPGKLRELRALLADLPLECLSLADVGVATDIPETGASLKENAILKARGYAELSGLTTLADDSGLEVDALGGEPGVHSSRWAGPGATDADRIRKLLERLRGVPPQRRQARFRAVAAIATPDGRLYTTEGTLEGVIADRPRGSGGFGYDPVFLVPDLGKTVAELDPETKNRISHRARAILAARPILEQLAAEEM